MRAGRTLRVFAYALGLGACVFAVEADGRPGGGHSYSGSSRSSGASSSSYSSSSSSYSGSSSSTYSGSDGGSESLFISFFLTLVASGLALLGSKINRYAWASNEPDFSAYDVVSQPHWGPVRALPQPDIFAKIRTHDPNFSQIIFEDFVHELFVRSHEARANDTTIRRLGAYLAPQVQGQLRSRGARTPTAVEGVVLGSIRFARQRTANGYDYINVRFECNYTEVYPAREPNAQDFRVGFYARERWTLVRKQGIQSRLPHAARALNCPSCGAPVAESHHDRCEYCGVVDGTAEFDWLVQKVVVEAEETRGPTLTGYAEEVGTGYRTMIDGSRDRALAQLQARDPEWNIEAFTARVRLIYRSLNEAWTSLQWEDARPYLSDRLWFSMRYWIHAYRDQGLQNLMLMAKSRHLELVKVASDPFYDAIVVRVFATAIDQTINVASGVIVGGSDQPREYSEYWTLIRSRPEKRGDFVGKNCPSCGAALAINMAGNCQHCGVKVRGGEFDWVLSKIEQDEAYGG